MNRACEGVISNNCKKINIKELKCGEGEKQIDWARDESQITNLK